MGTDWTAYRAWHELLDALSAEQGHLDNLALAEQLCAASGNHTHAAFDTAVKNLRNWRHGVHIPQRRNFLLLTRLLKVDSHEGLREHWNRLYSQARNRLPIEAEGAEEASAQPNAFRPGRRFTIAGVVVFVAGLALTTAYGSLPIFADASDEGFEGINAEYRKNVTVKVGDAVIIHGARGNNCGPAPEWEVTRKLLPELVTGTLSDGGLGTRYSRQCDGRVAARAILFTATAPGTEQTSIYGDPITITVQ